MCMVCFWVPIFFSSAYFTLQVKASHSRPHYMFSHTRDFAYFQTLWKYTWKEEKNGINALIWNDGFPTFQKYIYFVSWSSKDSCIFKEKHNFTSSCPHGWGFFIEAPHALVQTSWTAPMPWNLHRYYKTAHWYIAYADSLSTWSPKPRPRRSLLRSFNVIDDDFDDRFHSNPVLLQTGYPLCLSMCHFLVPLHLHVNCAPIGCRLIGGLWCNNAL